MPTLLSPHRFGSPRTTAQLSVIHACEEIFILFCDLMDDGRVDDAVSLHLDGVVFYDVGRDEPAIGVEPLRARLNKVRFSYPERKTLHTPSNFRFHEVTDQRAECRVVIMLSDLVRNPAGRGIGRYSTELLGYAAEEVVFAPDREGAWRFHTRRIGFLAGAKRLPIGTLPGNEL